MSHPQNVAAGFPASSAHSLTSAPIHSQIPLLPELSAPPRGVSPGPGGDSGGLWACAPCCITLPQIRTEPLGGGSKGEAPRAALLSCLVPPAVVAALGLEHKGQGGGSGAGGGAGAAGCEALLLMRFVAQVGAVGDVSGFIEVGLGKDRRRHGTRG